MSYTQDDLCSFWQKTKDANESVELDKNILVSIIVDEELIQMMSLGSVEPYSDFSSSETSVTYPRRRQSKNAPWGEWEIPSK